MKNKICVGGYLMDYEPVVNHSHHWQCPKCRMWVGEEYNECSVCKHENVKYIKRHGWRPDDLDN
jgi:hypothetical protein